MTTMVLPATARSYFVILYDADGGIVASAKFDNVYDADAYAHNWASSADDRSANLRRLV